MSRKVNLDLDTDSLRVIDPNEKPEKESDDIIDPNQGKLENTDILIEEEIIEDGQVVEKKEIELIDANQISLEDEEEFSLVNNAPIVSEEEQQTWVTNELRINNIDLNVNKSFKKAKNPTKSVMVWTLFVNLFLAIWLFVVCMVPPIANNVGDITPIYAKAAENSTLFSLTAVGYVNLILFLIPSLSLNIANAVLMNKNKEKYFKNAKKAERISFEFFRYFFIINIIVMSVNLLVPPLSTMHENISYYSMMYYADLSKTVGWYFIIVSFSISLSAYVITLIAVSLLQTSFLNFEKIKERNEAMKKFFEEVKTAKKQKKLNKAKKKQILAEEEELLSNLKEVSEEEKSLISEEEFQERMKSNNEIRNKIKELQKQQEELRKHQSVFLKKKRQESINRRPIKPKKQEITIPDKELEEIFKNIELD